MAEFSSNNSTSSFTNLTPFFSWQGFHPRANIFSTPSKVPHADDFIFQLEDVQLVLIKSLRHAKEVQARYYNARTQPSTIYAIGDWVWLTRRFIPSTRPSSKLDYKRIGPFQISQLIRSNAAQLDLGSSYRRLHPVFNVSLLTPYVSPSLGGQPASTAPTNSSPLLVLIHQWSHVAGILDYQNRSKHRHEYLL